MGKRKSRIVVRKRAMAKLDSEFDCPFCHHQKCINVKLDMKNQIGQLWCRVCSVDYVQSGISKLFQAVDLYSDWLDECAAVNSPSRRRRRIGEYKEDNEGDDEFYEYQAEENEEVAMGIGTAEPLEGLDEIEQQSNGDGEDDLIDENDFWTTAANDDGDNEDEDTYQGINEGELKLIKTTNVKSNAEEQSLTLEADIPSNALSIPVVEATGTIDTEDIHNIKIGVSEKPSTPESKTEMSVKKKGRLTKPQRDSNEELEEEKREEREADNQKLLEEPQVEVSLAKV